MGALFRTQLVVGLLLLAAVPVAHGARHGSSSHAIMVAIRPHFARVATAGQEATESRVAVLSYRTAARRTYGLGGGAPSAATLLARGGQAASCQRSKGAAPSGLLCTVAINGADIAAVDERTNRVFVNCNSCGPNGASVLYVLDATTGTPLRSVPVGPNSQAVAVDAAAGLVFVANQTGHSISTLDARTGRVQRTTHIRGDPVTLAVAARADRIVALDANDSNVTVLDATSGRVVASLTLPRPPLTMAATEHTGRLFVADNSTTTVLDARIGAVLRTVPGASGPMVVDERNGRVYTGAGVVLDARTGNPLRLQLARGALLLALDAPRRRMIGTTSASVDISDADSGHLLHSVSVDINTQPMSTPAIIARSGHALVLLSSALDKDGIIITPGYLLVIDERTGAVVRRINVGGEQSFEDFTLVAVDNRTNRAFVIENRAVAVFDTARL